MKLAGISDIAELLGVSRQVVFNWYKRGKFYENPIAILAMGPIWDLGTPLMSSWMRERKGKHD